MRCSLHAKYRYEDKLPTRQNAKASFGTIIHHSLQYYYESRGDIEGAIARFKGNWANPERLHVEPDYWPKGTNFNTLMAKGLEVLAAVHEKAKWNKIDVIGTEIPFLVPFGVHELTGYVDLLTIEKSGTGKQMLCIYDHKTNGRKPATAELTLDVQFTAYVFATFQKEFWMGGMDPEFPGIENGEWYWETVASMLERRALWHHLYTAQVIDAGPRATIDFERMYRVCCEIEHAVNLGVAVPTIGESCQWCDYQEPCRLEIPVAIAGLEDKNDNSRWI